MWEQYVIIAIGLVLVGYGVFKWRYPKLNGWRQTGAMARAPGEPGTSGWERVVGRFFAILFILIGAFFLWLAVPEII